MADFKWVSNASEFSVQAVDDDGKPQGEKLVFPFERWSDVNCDKMAQFGRKSFFQARASQVPVAEKFAYWRKLHELMESDEFEFERQAGARVVAAWVEVLAEKQGVSVSEVQTALAGYSKEQRARIQVTVAKQFANEIAERMARKAVDLGDFLTDEDENETVEE